MSLSRAKTIRDVERMLGDTGLTYEIVRGKRHYKCRLEGVMVAVINTQEWSKRDKQNVQAHIRRRAKEIATNG